MSLDALSALEADIEKPSRMPIIDGRTDKPFVDKDGKEAYLDILAPDSEQARRVDLARNRQTMRRLRSGRNRIADDENYIEEQVEKIAAVTVGWYLVSPSGNPVDLPWSPDTAKKLFGNPKMGWLLRQAVVWHNNEANFLQTNSNS